MLSTYNKEILILCMISILINKNKKQPAQKKNRQFPQYFTNPNNKHMERYWTLLVIRGVQIKTLSDVIYIITRLIKIKSDNASEQQEISYATDGDINGNDHFWKHFDIFTKGDSTYAVWASRCAPGCRTREKLVTVCIRSHSSIAYIRKSRNSSNIHKH